MSRFLVISVFALFLYACGSKDASKQAIANQESVPAADGAKVFKLNCELCHGADGKLGANGSKDLSISQLSLDERIAIITKGKGAMVAYENILSLSEIKAVAEYTLTLKK
jgi:mono/diheme cytochrome c family protein